jgi:hypothetical protein
LIEGNIVSADTTNYVNLTSHDSVAYLCCDTMNNSNIDPSMMINTLMSNQPKAIVLYSQQGNCCGLDGSNLIYQSIFTMTSKDTASETLNWTASGKGTLQATISGNASTSAANVQETQGSNNSAVAMSILYSITGLITLLFLIIIATGAVRAHRYPERYGPRAGYGGRPRQSRAKGLARAVLETLPIVKFGDPMPAKKDPTMDTEFQHTRSSQDAVNGTRLSAIPEEPQAQRASKALNERSVAAAVATDSRAAGAAQDASASGGSGSNGPEGDNLGCSICTEDFLVGEDVRVLPCDHKFHPPCIDPWLINVSGTCPLWYVYTTYLALV